MSKCWAQEPDPPAQHPLEATTELVKVDVSVLDKHGDFVGGLQRQNFRIVDSGVEQPIAFYTPVEAPAQVLVMIETSPAVYLIHDEHLVAAYALLEGLAADDQVALVAYDEAPHAILPFTADKSALLSALGRIQYTVGMGELHFYDSVSTVLDWLVQTRGKRAFVLLTTGLDSSPPARWNALVQKLRGEDVVIFPVALGGSLRGYAGKKSKRVKSAPKPNSKTNAPSSDSGESLGFAKADSALLSLANITGGHAYFPESSRDFVPMYHEIASALRHQYVLGIAPVHDGQFHSLTVQVLASGGQAAKPKEKNAEYRVFARAGYLAPAP